MSRSEDLKTTLFLKYDENSPERLFEYQIWFNLVEDTTIILSNHEEEGYGTLDKENAKVLEAILLHDTLKD
jgi:hypothetical protein